MNMFHPGETWNDTNGVAINAHGGGILFYEGTYWWFGEHKIAGEEGNRSHVGVHVYASENLLEWRDEGIALAMDDSPGSQIPSGCVLERPKVIFNPASGKFVMWFHLEPKGTGYAGALSGVSTDKKSLLSPPRNDHFPTVRRHNRACRNSFTEPTGVDLKSRNRCWM